METMRVYKEEIEKNSIFEFHQSYTYMDEDYENHIIVGIDGELATRQVQTYCYEPDATEKRRFANSNFSDSIKSVLEKYKTQIDSINCADWDKYSIFKIKLFDKKFSSNLYYLPDFIPELLKEVKNVIDSFHKGIIDWNYIFSSEECKHLR